MSRSESSRKQSFQMGNGMTYPKMRAKAHQPKP
jgi:hypothetical protein